MLAILRKRDFGERLGIALLFILPIVIAVAIYAFISSRSVDDGLNYRESADGSGYTLVKYKGDSALVEIPSKYKGKPVVAIAEDAFKNNSTLESVRIPGSVKVIESNAFSGCSKLLDVTLNSGTEVIEANAFANCPYIAYLNFCDTLSSIEPGAFYGCPRIAYITIPESNSTYHTNGNSVIHTESKTLVLGGRISEIPDDGSVTRIGEMAFAGSIKLYSITIPEGVTEIGEKAFYECTLLTEIYLPKSLTDIRDGGFGRCPGVSSVVYAGNAAEWEKVEIGEENFYFESCIRYYNGSEDEAQ